ncbi:MAG: hypothetical protein R3F41_06625 [Gammaproteobacteria bacterium]|nr:hypothetical protein [Pseudomonadales bacterium]MCP5348591.1 hypothetical protein [Pseudomonadales bacterium]
MPTELIRKGRMGEIFLFDLPDRQVRADIFAIYLNKRGIDDDNLEFTLLAEKTRVFSGAEI